MKNNLTIPKGWAFKKLSDVLDYERPDSYIVKSTSYNNKARTPVLTANKSFVLGHTDEDFGIYKNIPAIIFDDFTTDSKFVDFPFKIKSSAIKILKEKGKDIDLRFVYEKMKSIDFPTGSHKRFYISQYQNMKVLMPPFSEQQKIAGILGAVDDDIAKTQAVIEATEKLKRGLLEELLSRSNNLKIVKFSELVKLRNEKSKLKQMNDDKYIGLEHIEQGGGRLLGFGNSSETKSINSVFKKNDILFGKLRPYLRKYWKAEFDGVCTSELLIFKPYLESDIDFVLQLVQSEKFIQHSISKSFGTKMPRTDWKIISEFEIKLPSPEGRKHIAEILSAVDEKISVNKKLKAKLTTLKKGLMQDLLSGEVRVK